MSMISLIYLAFVIIACGILQICFCFLKGTPTYLTAKKIVLLLLSYLFIIYVDWRFAILLFAFSIAVWLGARSHFAGLVIALSILLLMGVKLAAQRGTGITIPIGISFYTFSAISYLVDVKRGKSSSQSFLDVSLYLSFFPKLTAGPIQKGTDFWEQVNKEIGIKKRNVLEGVQIFVFGLFKKLVLADHLAVFVDQVYATPKAFGSMTVFMAVMAYSLQIYFDFSGYSDIAVGTAGMLGIVLPRNFNLPYLSQNVTEFWKRWHITLSKWLQEYLYISLGGSRKGEVRTYINLLLTMILGGLWHGLNWTFAIWGALHGMALCAHKVWMRFTKSNEREHTWLSKGVATVSTFFFVSFAWIFFRAESIEQAMDVIVQILRFEKGLEQPYMWLWISVVIVLVVSGITLVKAKNIRLENGKYNRCKVNAVYPLLNLERFGHLVVFFVFCGLTIGLAYTGGSPFIYGGF